MFAFQLRLHSKIYESQIQNIIYGCNAMGGRETCFCYFLKFENSINYYIYKSNVTFQPYKITVTYFDVLIDKIWYCNINCLICGRITNRTKQEK